MDGKLNYDVEEEEDRLEQGQSNAVIAVEGGGFVTADTSLTEFLATGAFVKHEMWIVMDGTEFSGVVTPRQLLSLPARLCFLALVLELEEVSLDLCKLFPKPAALALGSGRLEIALKVLKRKMQVPYLESNYGAMRNFRLNRSDFENSYLASMLIDSTTFIDKATIIRKLQLTIEVTNKDIKTIFTRAERLRNCCAHPTSDVVTLPFASKELTALVKDVSEMTRAIRETLNRELKDRAKSDVSSEVT